MDDSATSTPSISGMTALADAPTREALLSSATQLYRDVVADPKTFGPAATTIVQQSRAAGHPEALVLALRAQAWVERANLGIERAKKLLDDAARIARRHGFEEGLSEVLVTRAAVNLELGRLIPAQRDLDVAGRLGQRNTTAEITFQQAALYHNLGRLSQAADLYRRILHDHDASVVMRTKTANNLAIIESQVGRPDIAQQLVDLASALAPAAGPHLTAIVASTRAWITTSTGRLTQGLGEFAEAARLHTAAGLPLGEHYLEYVDALTDLRLLPEAHRVAVQAADEFDNHAVQLMAAEGMLRVAMLAALLGLESAADTAERARRRFAAQRRISWRARADVVISDIAFAAGEATPTTLATVRRAAATLDRIGLMSHAIDAHLSAGRVGLALGRRQGALENLGRATALSRTAPALSRLKGYLASALATTEPDRRRLAHCRAGLNDLAQHREAFASIELRVRASGHGAELGRLGLQVLMRNGSAAQVLAWMERTRAAALVAIEPAGDVRINDELAELRAVQGELLAAQQTGDGEPLSLLARQRGIEERIRRITWSSESKPTQSQQPSSLSELRTGLDRWVLVEYGVLDGRVFAVLVDGRRSRIVQLGVLSDIQYQVDVVMFGIRRLLRPARSAAALAAIKVSMNHALDVLRGLLLTPLKVPNDSSIVISPAGGLRRIPWSALHQGPIAVVPAASFWRRTLRRPDVEGDVLLVAGPELPGAVEEVTRVGELYDRPTVLLPPDSTIDAVLSALSTAGLAHMACHGRLRVDNPAFSALQVNDGLLTLHEMDIRGVAPPRMVLAACDSAMDATFEGNEVLGFVSALMARGTSALVASIVAVPDAASVPLMRGFHRQLKRGDRFADALFKARANMDLDDPHEFVNWCAFNAYGAA